MPEVSANTSEATLVGWLVAVGDSFSAHDPLATVETDKAAVDIEAEADGVLLASLVADGALVDVGVPIALIAQPGEGPVDVESALAALGRNAAAAAGDLPVDEPANDAPNAVGSAASSDGVTRTFASPLARRLARDAGLSLDEIEGTGPHSRIVRRDVEGAIERRASAGRPVTAQPATTRAAPAVPAAGVARFVDVPHTRMRRAIAARLLESTQTAPHFAVRATARVDALIALREQLNERTEHRISLNDLVVKAVAVAHRRVPDLNVQWLPDAVRMFDTVDIAIAVATETGLLTPVLRSVGDLTVTEVARRSAELVDQARRGALAPRDLEGGTITVSNLGMFGTEEFSAIINPPHAAILAVGAARLAPVVDGGVVVPRMVLSVTLSVDHRPVDGAMAARWMRELMSLLERPALILA